MSLMLINNIFLVIMATALILLVASKRTRQASFIDFLSVLGAVFSVSMISNSDHLVYTLEGTAFRITMCAWVVLHVIEKFRSYKK